MTDYGDIEPIVRIFCQKRGIDPDANVPVPCGDPGCRMEHYGPAWKCYEQMVRDGMALIEAISAHSAGGQ